MGKLDLFEMGNYRIISESYMVFLIKGHLNYLQRQYNIFCTEDTLLILPLMSALWCSLTHAFYPKQLKIHRRDNPLWSNVKLSFMLKDKMGYDRSCNLSHSLGLKHHVLQPKPESNHFENLFWTSMLTYVIYLFKYVYGSHISLYVQYNKITWAFTS